MASLPSRVASRTMSPDPSDTDAPDTDVPDTDVPDTDVLASAGADRGRVERAA